MSYELQRLADGRRALVMGLSWQAMLGESLDKQARQIARRAKATHFCRGGPRSNVVGTVAIRKSDPVRKLTLYAAAAAFARSQARAVGVVAVRVALTEDQIWIAAALNGAVLVESDKVCSLAQSQEHLEELRTRHPNLTLYGDGGDYSLDANLLQANLGPDTQLRSARADFRQVPMPLRIAGALALAYMAWDHGTDWWQQHQRQQARSDRSAVQIDAQALWRDALGTWSRGILLHGPDGLRALFGVLDSLPINPGRWQLAQVRCQPQFCEATYRRHRLGSRDSLLYALPADVNVSWEGFDTAVVRYPLSLPLQPLSVDALAPISSVDEHVANQLQRSASLWESARLNPVQQVSLATPMASGPNGPMAVQRPADLNLPVYRTFSLTGPLRSILALALPPNIAFDEITVQLTDGEARLSRSRLAATFEGTYYALPD